MACTTACTQVFDALACAACAPGAALGWLEVGAALSELMRVTWHGMHRWELDEEMSRKLCKVFEVRRCA